MRNRGAAVIGSGKKHQVAGLQILLCHGRALVIFFYVLYFMEDKSDFEDDFYMNFVECFPGADDDEEIFANSTPSFTASAAIGFANPHHLIPYVVL